MKTKLTEKRRKILRKIYGALSLSTALFVFQACYGPMQDFGADVYFQGVVESKTTRLPIPGIKVSIGNQPQYEITDSYGKFKIYTIRENEYYLRFEDIDDATNGAFLRKDTIINIVHESTWLNIYLNDK